MRYYLYMPTATNTRTYILIALILLTGTLCFFIISPFFIPVSLAAVFAVVLYPVFKRINHSVKGHSGIAALLTIILFIICVSLPLSILGSRLIGEAEHLAVTLTAPENANFVPNLAEQIGRRVNTVVPGSFTNVASKAVGAYNKGLSWIVAQSGYAFAQTLSFLVALFIFLITLFFFLKDAGKYTEQFIDLSPLSPGDTHSLAKRLALTINSVVRGNIIIALIQGTLATIGFTVFGVPNALIWGLSTSIAAFIPGVGTSLVLIPSVLYLFIIGHDGAGIGLAIWCALAVGTIDNMLGPRLVGSKAQLHPLAVLLSMLGGVSFFGPAGLFLGPVFVSLLVGLLALYAPHTK